MHCVPVKPKSSRDRDSKICVMTGPLVSLGKCFLFLRLSRLRFGYGLAGCSLASGLGIGVGAVTGLDFKAACKDGEWHLGGEAAGWPLFSSSHVKAFISSKRRHLGRAVEVGSVEGGNNIVKYGWIIGLSFFPLWKA